jgi:hypothetical protein
MLLEFKRLAFKLLERALPRERRKQGRKEIRKEETDKVIKESVTFRGFCATHYLIHYIVSDLYSCVCLSKGSNRRTEKITF